jgi:2'-5' RNA ligase
MFSENHYIKEAGDMSKIAVDIVLLPSAEMMDWAIELNKRLAGKAPDRIILNKQDSQPHISLAMGCIERGQVAQIGQILRGIAKKHSLGELAATGIRVERNSNGRNVSVLVEGYRQQSSFERFFPHITIGFGRAEGGAFPRRFKVPQLALCHLGNNCTCRQILATVPLCD